MKIENYTLAALVASTGINYWPPWRSWGGRKNPWGPPSRKPAELRDEEDLRKLRMAQERRERREKRRGVR